MLEELTASADEIRAMSPKDRAAFARDVLALTALKPFTPNSGAQTEAYFSEADILLYGGQPGGGKTSLLIGLAVNEHDRSMIVRKQYSDVQGVVDNAKGVIGSSDGFVGGMRPLYNKPGGGVVHFLGLARDDGMDESKQGTPHDFIGIDEGAQLRLDSIRMLLGWNRQLIDAKYKGRKQRCRMVIATNPPLTSDGDWMVDFFAPWLDEDHPNPAKQGELRWFIIDDEDKSVEVAGPETVMIGGKEFYPHSRTFIAAGLDDNPYIDKTDYMRRLQAMPAAMRNALLSGNFMLAKKDANFQLIPSAWVRAAQARWTEKPPQGVPMTSMGLDIAQGGKDASVLAIRHDGWFAPLISVPGEETETGSETAAMVVRHRRNNAQVVIDMGGGYGGGTALRLQDNGIEPVKFNAVGTSMSRTRDGTYKFANRRAAAWWKFMEALDPDQDGGSPIALPPDKQLLSALCAPTYKLEARGYKIEDKEEVKKRVKWADKADAVIMCWNENKIKHGGKWNHKPGAHGFPESTATTDRNAAKRRFMRLRK